MSRPKGKGVLIVKGQRLDHEVRDTLNYLDLTLCEDRVEIGSILRPNVTYYLIEDEKIFNSSILTEILPRFTIRLAPVTHDCYLAPGEYNSLETTDEVIALVNKISYFNIDVADKLHNLKELNQKITSAKRTLAEINTKTIYAEEVFNSATQKIVKSFDKGIMATPITELNFPLRAMNCLHNNNIKYVHELLAVSEQELLKYPNFGRKSLNQCKTVLAQHDLYFSKL